MAINVSFARGSSAGFQTLPKDPNTIYFITDTHEIYLGGEKYSIGKDIAINITGSGDIIKDATWDPAEKSLTFLRGSASDIASISNAIQSATAGSIVSVSSDRSSAIDVDSSDPKNVKLILNLATGDNAGNVKLTQSSDGLKATVDIPDVSTSVTSTSTDSEVPTAKAVWDVIQSSSGYQGAMRFLGISTTKIADGERQIPTIKGQSVPLSELKPGDIVLYKPETNGSGYIEFVWDGDMWVQLGDEDSYVHKSIQVVAGKGLSGGGNLSSNVELTHAETGDPDVSQYVGPHVTSAVTRINVDEFGHIQDVEFSEVSIGDLHTRESVLEAKVQDLKERVDALDGGGESLRNLIVEIVNEELDKRGFIWKYPEDLDPENTEDPEDPQP